jgi:hypothetical protein
MGVQCIAVPAYPGTKGFDADIIRGVLDMIVIQTKVS